MGQSFLFNVSRCWDPCWFTVRYINKDENLTKIWVASVALVELVWLFLRGMLIHSCNCYVAAQINGVQIFTDSRCALFKEIV